MSDSADMIMPMLCEMRAEMRERFDGVDLRLAKLEEAQKSFKHALTSDTLLSRLLTGEFEERIEALEQRVAAFEGSKA